MKLRILPILFLFRVISAADESKQWFVQEVGEYDEEGDIFSQEELIPLQKPTPRHPPRQAGGQPSQNTPKKAETKVIVKAPAPPVTSQRRHDNHQHGVMTELADQHLIPVHQQKPKAAPSRQQSSVPGTPPRSGAKSQTLAAAAPAPARTGGASKTLATGLETVQDSGKVAKRKLLSEDGGEEALLEEEGIVEIPGERKLCEEPERDVNCLFEEEELIPVGKTVRQQKKDLPKTDSSKSQEKKQDRQPSHVISRAEDHVMHRRLMQAAEVDKSEQTVSNDSRIEVDDRSKSETAESQETHPKKAMSAKHPKEWQTGTEEEEGEKEEEKEEEEDDREMMEVISRAKRQVVDSMLDDPGSGDTTIEPTTVVPTGDGSHIFSKTLRSNTTLTVQGFPLNLTFPGSGPITDAENQDITQEVTKQLEKFFLEQNITDVTVENVNVTRNPDGTVSVNWNLKLANAGAKPEERAQAFLSSLGNFLGPSQFTLFNDTFSVLPVDLSNLANKTVDLLSDPCQRENPCDFGYECIKTTAYQGTCIHRCYVDNYSQKCNEGSCELNSQTGQPYCVCTNQFEGEFCDKPRTSDKQTGLTTPEVIGTTAGALIVLAALGSGMAYFLICKKRSPHDISFSYLEDQDQDIEGFSDASSKLYNCYLDRPRVTVEPLDIYGMNHEFNS